MRLWCSGDDVNGGIYAHTAFSLAEAEAEAAQQQLLLLFRWRNLYLPPVFVFLCALHSSLRLDTHTHTDTGKHSCTHTHTRSYFAYFSSLRNLFVYPADCCSLSSPYLALLRRIASNTRSTRTHPLSLSFSLSRCATCVRRRKFYRRRTRSTLLIPWTLTPWRSVYVNAPSTAPMSSSARSSGCSTMHSYWTVEVSSQKGILLHLSTQLVIPSFLRCQSGAGFQGSGEGLSPGGQ